MIKDILNVSSQIHVMRDPTRGGIASSLNEIAGAAKVGITINEDKIPIMEEVRGACEILGLDPLYIANEGKLLVFVSQEDADKVLDSIRSNEYGKDAEIIGEVTEQNSNIVNMKTRIGSNRIVDMISGEQLPRIC
jgi:hydrogenase expression/formation protein HypE